MNLRIEQLSPLDLGQDGTDARRKWPPTQWRVLKKAHNWGWTDFHTEHFIILLLEANIFLFLIKLLLIFWIGSFTSSNRFRRFPNQTHFSNNIIYIFIYISAKIWNTGGETLTAIFRRVFGDRRSGKGGGYLCWTGARTWTAMGWWIYRHTHTHGHTQLKD